MVSVVVSVVAVPVESLPAVVVPVSEHENRVAEKTKVAAKGKIALRINFLVLVANTNERKWLLDKRKKMSV